MKKKPAIIAGIILAAGAGRRMDGGRGAKLLLPYRGAPLVAHVARKALASCDTVLAVVGCNAEQVGPVLQKVGVGLQIIHAATWHEGQAASLRAGLAALDAETAGALVFLGDQPLVRRTTLAAVATAFRADPGAFVAPCHQGQRGNPVCIPRAWFARAMAEQGDKGARLLLGHPEARVRLVEVFDPGVLRDVDTSEDYQALDQN